MICSGGDGARRGEEPATSAVLHNDVKMWPVALPDAARVRWDYSLRAVRHALSRGKEDADEENIDIICGTIGLCLKALPKVPNDEGSGTNGGCKGFGDRLKRMEFSALTRTPLAGATALRAALAELSDLWPKFAEDTDG